MQYGADRSNSPGCSNRSYFSRSVGKGQAWAAGDSKSISKGQAWAAGDSKSVGKGKLGRLGDRKSVDKGQADPEKMHACILLVGDVLR